MTFKYKKGTKLRPTSLDIITESNIIIENHHQVWFIKNSTTLNILLFNFPVSTQLTTTSIRDESHQ